MEWHCRFWGASSTIPKRRGKSGWRETETKNGAAVFLTDPLIETAHQKTYGQGVPAKAMENPRDEIMPSAGRPRPDRTSAMLHAIAHEGDGPRISFGDIVAGLRNRSFGLSMLVFSLPCCLPMPRGFQPLVASSSF